MSQMYAWHPLVGRARTALDVWARVIEALANGALHDEYALEDMTAELFDATSWAALVVATEEKKA